MLESAKTFRFGEFTLDGDRRLVLRGDDALPIPSKAFQLLELLLSRRPGAVSRQEIQDALWPESLVTDTTLATVVSHLRRALGETARDARLVRTVWGLGYAFDGEASEEPAGAPSPPRHVLVWGSRELPLQEGENVLGRDPDLVVAVVHPSVSRQHARVTVAGPKAAIEDLASKNGTFVEGERIVGRRPLRLGDRIRVGTVDLLYVDTVAAAASDTKTAR
jgi:DNA-binding winged helix-turn-helix (wHTH) protein